VPERTLRAGLDRVGPQRIRVHDLRHALASFFMMAGGNLFDLQKILGHSTPQLVSDTYAHLSPAHLANQADRISFSVPGPVADVLPLRIGPGGGS
jgi:integrase